MSRSWSRIVMVVVAPFVGCAAIGSRVYEPQRVPIEASQADLVSLVVEYASQAGWTVVRVRSGRPALVEMLAPEVHEGGVLMRDRWIFLLVDGDVRVEKRLEAMFDPHGTWDSSDVVCSTYEYEREQRTLLELVKLEEMRRARQASSGALAVSRR